MKQSEELMELMKKTECPFTWDLDEIKEVIRNYVESRNHDDEDFVPLLKWIRLLVNAYESVQKKNLLKAFDYLKSAEDTWNSVKQKHENNISLNVLENIYNCTKCFVLFEENRFDEIAEILSNLNENVNCTSNAIDRSTLNGCKSIAWSKYKEAGELVIKSALNYINLAIEDNKNCDVWYFILGKNLRRQRRVNNFLAHPTKKEEMSFQKAYELSKEPTFGIYFAQLHKEKRSPQRALKIYKEIYSTKPESTTINLRLALGFMRLDNNFQLAKECLDYAEKRIPDDSMFLHYKGIYLENKKDFKEAAKYFKRACDGNNYGADNSFLKCQAKAREKYDFVKHLKEMLITYKNQEGRILDITLQLAACYYMYNHDVPNAAKCYLEALEKFPNNSLFEYHQCILGGRTCIYTFLQGDFLPNAFSITKLDSETIQICKKLQDICNNRVRVQRKKNELNFSKLRIS